MSTADTIRTAAMRLARGERADLARQLIESLDEDPDQADGDIEGAWLAEVERRLGEVERGAASFEPWETVEQRIAEQLRQLRR